MAHLIDRRLNDRGKNSVNRERFLRRYKSHVQEAVRRMVGERKLSDLEQGGEVRVHDGHDGRAGLSMIFPPHF